MNNLGSMKTYSGASSKRLMEPLTGFKGVLAGIGIFIIILFIGVNVYDTYAGNKHIVDEVDLTSEIMYKPSPYTQVDVTERLKAAYQKTLSSACPCAIQPKAQSMNINNATWGGHQYYTAICEMVSEDSIVEGSSRYRYATSTDKYLSEYYNIKDDECYILVAPARYRFINANTDSSNKIVIEFERSSNSDPRYRLTFYNVAAWFCAGTMSEGKSAILSHRSHGTVVGNSQNSFVTSGAAGDVLGYGNNMTYYEFLVSEDNGETWRVLDFPKDISP